MKLTQRILSINFWFLLLMTLLLVVLYETELLLPGNFVGDRNFVFFMQVVMEFVTIAVIPVALKLFSLKTIHRKLVEQKESALLFWGTARINLLCLPMLINTFMYYQAALSPAFGYMAIILFLSSFFVYPSMSRCLAETEDGEKPQV